MMCESVRKVQMIARTKQAVACYTLSWDLLRVLSNEDALVMSAVGFKQMPLTTGDLSQHLQPFGFMILIEELRKGTHEARICN